MTPDFIDGLGQINVRKHRDPRSKIEGEVVATFETKEARDAVKAESKNLAGSTDRAGIRLHIPGYLSTNFKLLENLGYQMRAVDGNVRRVVKFDDEKQDLILDFKVGDTWKRIRPAEAAAAKMSKSFAAPSGPVEMDSSGIADFFATAGTPATGANAQARP